MSIKPKCPGPLLELDSLVDTVDKKPSTSNMNRLVRNQFHPCFTLLHYHSAVERLLKLAVENFCSDNKFGPLWIRWQHKFWFWHSPLTFWGNENYRSSSAPVVMISLAISESDGSTNKSFLTFLGNIHSRSSSVLLFHTKDNIKLKSFTDVAIDERTESKATKSKIKSEVEANYLLTNCWLFLLIV